MKKRSLPLVLLSLLGSTLLQAGCVNRLQLYEGPPRPESEEGTLGYNPELSVLNIASVDGERLVLPPVGMLHGRSALFSLHLLPGEHTVFVCPPWRLYRSSVLGSEALAAANIGAGLEFTSDEQKDAVWNSIDGWLLKFVVEAGHHYMVTADSTGAGGLGKPVWADYELETVVVGQDTLILERPEGWQSWTPYVADVLEGGTKKRVSEIVSGGM